MATYCPFCSKEIDPDGSSTYRSITGWEGRRSKGGANVIHLREETGSYAHYVCVDREKRARRNHVTPGQEALL